MAKIIYFGTERNGKSGYRPIGIDENLTNEKYDIWSECDNQAWICNVYKNPGWHLIRPLIRPLIRHHSTVYTNYVVPFSADDKRAASHTKLFWKVYIQKMKW